MENYTPPCWLLLGLKQLLNIVDMFLSKVFDLTIEFGKDVEKKQAKNCYQNGAQVVTILWRAVAHAALPVSQDQFLYRHERWVLVQR